MYDYTIIGGGIIGLSVGKILSETHPDKKTLLLEKEKEVAAHQTGHNSGVIHSGIYYTPGSVKARFAKQGNKSMVQFCKERGIKYDMCGKVIIATNEKERPLLDDLYERGLQNELDIERLNQGQLLEVEPNVKGVEALHVKDAGIVDYTEVAKAFASIILENDGDIHFNEEVQAIQEAPDKVTIKTSKTTYKTDFVINCAGLQSDRIAKMAGYHIDMKIIPFRGEYFTLKEDKTHLVKNLIYPVPNPEFPFLGVHFTRGIHGDIEAGPNAVLGFKREGYKKTDINIKDLSETLTYKGFLKLAGKYMKVGMGEMVRSVSKQKFTESLQELVPSIQKEDLVPATAGVRAQALNNDGSLVDDFVIIKGKKSLHVCNAPSPAATASIEIGKEIVSRLE